MASTAVLPAMNGAKTLHPFFTKINGQNDTNETTSSDDHDQRDTADESYDESEKVSKPVKKRKSRTSLHSDGKTQKTLQEIVNSRAAVIQDDREIPNSCSSEPTLSSPKRKRQRTSPPAEVAEVEVKEDEQQDEPVITPERAASPQVIIPASSPLPVQPEPSEDAAPSPPKKMLRLNARGTFSSPPSKKPKEESAPEPEAPKKRGRPRKTKEVEKLSRVVVMEYDNEIGHRIERIMSGEERLHEEVKLTPKKPRTPRKQAPSKPTHPFFLGKPKEPVPKPESPKKTSAVTPGKLRRETMSFDRSHALETTDTWTSSLLRDRLIMKQPGAMEPAWPSREQAHVRGLDGSAVENTLPPSSPYQKRKQKTVKRPMSENESILNQQSLQAEEKGELREDGFREPHPSLRLPQKLLISGEEVLELASKEFSTPVLNTGVDELSLPTPPQQPHPAIDGLRKRISNTLSAFDEGRGEAYSWAHKYAPTTAAEVLQLAREMDVLKRWLTSLTVTSVGTASRSDSRQSPKPESKPKKKRRRKNKDMDDFVVDDGEEAVHDMDELTDPEDSPLVTGQKGIKSVVQASGDGVKLSNAVLLTGPDGCGKTAAAYAVAKELGFKVFEISSCEKRSGKDVLDKVGDMAENHLVKHHGTDPGEVSASEERNDEAFNQDLASGRQGKMDSFFRPKASGPKSSPKKTAKPKVKAIEQLQKAIKKPAKDQQQSLILLEEVDVLFKEDKDFWSTVFKLISTSRRPFIMTCNDEDLVPLQAMTLHAILRFTPPPVDLVADYLLAMAAAEGHLIKRDAVLSLYKCKDSDLRSAISDLQFWCQMGIGDPRGGLTWIYQRYPPGSDLDAQGRRLRVVSQGTFQAGMNNAPDARIAEEDQALWALDAFGVDPSTLMGWGPEPEVSQNMLPGLKEFSRFAASMSTIDVFTQNTETLDTSQPPMPDKARSQYIEGMALLQTDEVPRYDTLSQQLTVASTLAAYRISGLYTNETISSRLADSISAAKSYEGSHLTRHDFAVFDAISVPNESILSTHPGLSQSVFDGPLEPIATDLAPYVRLILQHEAALSEQQEKLNTILGEGRSNKRARTTRAARSALQGGQRSLTRREKWFSKDLDVASVLATAGDNWPKTTVNVDEFSREGSATPSPSAEST